MDEVMAAISSSAWNDILHELSQYKDFGVMTFQAEDEIAAITSSIGLECHHAEVFVLREFMQDVRSRSNRVTALEKRQARLLRRGDKPECQRLVTAHASVESRGELGRRNLITDLERFRSFAVRIAAFQRELVRFHEQRLVLELVLNPADRRLARAVVEPVAHAQREEVFAAVHRLGVEAQMLQGTPGQPFELDRKQPE